MLQLPGKNIAFAFSDPAGANACMALAKMTFLQFNSVSLYSNRNHNSLSEPVIQIQSTPSLDGVDTLFLGTSHPASSGYFELNCLKEAKKKGVYSIAFIDHWVNFKLRFTDVDNEFIYPNEIWVIDNKAKELAIAEGLPEQLIKVTQSPYHTYLRQYWQSKWSGKSYLSTLGIKTSGYHIVFAPDPLSLRNKKEDLGFTEVEGLTSILRIIKKFNDLNLNLIVKSHPLQPIDVLNGVIKDMKVSNVTLIESADTLELLKAANIVIGFYSNILLDAKAIGKEVLRYFPGKAETDLLNHERSLIKVKSEGELCSYLKKVIYG